MLRERKSAESEERCLCMVFGLGMAVMCASSSSRWVCDHACGWVCDHACGRCAGQFAERAAERAAGKCVTMRMFVQNVFRRASHQVRRRRNGSVQRPACDSASCVRACDSASCEVSCSALTFSVSRAQSAGFYTKSSPTPKWVCSASCVRQCVLCACMR